MVAVDDQLAHWKELLQTVNKETVPLNCVKKVTLKLKQGKTKTINIDRLRKEHLDIEEIGEVLSSKLITLSSEIVDIDYVIDVERVREIIQPITDEILDSI